VKTKPKTFILPNEPQVVEFVSRLSAMYDEFAGLDKEKKRQYVGFMERAIAKSNEKYPDKHLKELFETILEAFRADLEGEK
jgi:hypothetical protein